ncbi:MAG: ROK family protein [Paenibacillaceae bacterium]
MIPLHERIAGQKHKDTFELIRKQATVSKIELLEQTQFSVSTLTRILEELRDQRLIMEAGFRESTGGRRPIIYQLNPTYGYVFGLDISRTYSMLVLCDMQMNKLDSRRWALNEGMTPKVLVQEIVYTVRNILAVHGIPLTSVLGMGVGAVGPLDRFSGTILEPLYFPANGWNDVPICEMLRQELDLPIILDNGANMAILGEYWASRNEACEHLLYIHLGIGIRSAMMTGGKVVYGAMDMESSIGQMIIQSDGLRLRETSNFGGLENYVSFYALEQKARTQLKQGRKSILQQMEGIGKDPERLSFLHLKQAIGEQDPMVVELFTQAAAYFGIGLANLLNILHPEKVILGGPLINIDPFFFETSTKVAIEKTHYYPTYQVTFSRGNLGEDALVIGAAVMVVNKMTE